MDLYFKFFFVCIWTIVCNKEFINIINLKGRETWFFVNVIHIIISTVYMRHNIRHRSQHSTCNHYCCLWTHIDYISLILTDLERHHTVDPEATTAELIMADYELANKHLR